MAIVQLRKVTLLGQAARREQVLSGLQNLGCIHLIDLIGKSAGKDRWQHPIRSDLHTAIRYLEACPEQRPPAPHAAGYEPQQIIASVLENHQRSRELIEKKEELNRQLKKLEPFGDFRLPEADELGGQRLWFYKLRHRQVKALRNLGCTYSRVSRDAEFEYYVVISEQEPALTVATPIDLGPVSLGQLQTELVAVDQQLESLHIERIAMTRWVARLKADLASFDDEAERVTAGQRMLEDGEVFALQGWIPKKAVEQIKSFAKAEGLALTVQKPSGDDSPPTLLSNPKAVAGAEGAVTFYMTPSYQAWDPTWIMYLSFSLFFAMIMADAGYGVVLAAVLILVFGRLGRTEALRRFRYLAMFIVLVTIGYGVLIGSYFGISPPAGSTLDQWVWKSGGKSIMEDREAMMLLTAGIGVVHLAIANIIVAWRRMGSGRAISHIGWASTFIGGLVMAVGKLDDPAFVPWLATALRLDANDLGDTLWSTGSFLLACGLGAIFFFSSDRPLFSSRPNDWLWRPVEGLMGLTNISKAFGDALSYLRLFALGLASAQLAITFNGLASQVSAFEGIGLLLGLLIFLAGHTLNLVLGVVGGVVHGLRLNCIEFFSWSLTDEGYPFQAFRKKADC